MENVTQIEAKNHVFGPIGISLSFPNHPLMLTTPLRFPDRPNTKVFVWTCARWHDP